MMVSCAGTVQELLQKCPQEELADKKQELTFVAAMSALTILRSAA